MKKPAKKRKPHVKIDTSIEFEQTWAALQSWSAVDQAWVDAVYDADAKQDTAALLALMNVPPLVVRYVKDLFDRKLGPRKIGRGRRMAPLWQDITLIEHLARLVDQQREQDKGVKVAEVVDRVRKNNPELAEQVSRKKLIKYCSGKHGREQRQRVMRRGEWPSWLKPHHIQNKV